MSMKTTKLLIKTNLQKYSILIGNKLVSKISKIMNDNFIKFEKCLLIVDKNVPQKMVSEIKKSLKNKKIFILQLMLMKKIKVKKP